MRLLRIFLFLGFGSVSLALVPENNARSTVQEIQVRNISQNETDIMQFSTQDYLSHWIETKLGMTAGQFLVLISNTIAQVHNEVNSGISALQEFMKQIDSKTQDRIRNLINNSLMQALAGMSPIRNDLGQIIPLISSTFARSRTIGDTIYAILKVTFEAFLRAIAATLQQSFDLISAVMIELNTIAGSLSSPQGSQLRTISNTYLLRCLNLIRPVLTNLHEVLPESQNTILSDVVSRSLNIDVVNASVNLDLALHNITKVLEEFVLQTNSMLAGYPNVKDKINKIITASVTEAEDLIDPILAVLFQFTGANHLDKDYPNDIVSTIFGLSLQDFLTYIDHVGQRLPSIYNRTDEDIRAALKRVTPRVRNWIERRLEEIAEKVQASLDPFICAISPIMGHRIWVSVDDFLKNEIGNEGEQKFCDFSLKTGHNVELLEHLVSDVFGFNVTEAAKAMADALSELEILYSKSSQKITTKLSALSPLLVAEVKSTLNASLTNSTRMILPAIDVLGDFLPRPGRLDRDVVLGMVRSIQNLNLENFIEYMSVGTERASEVAAHAFRRIHTLVEQAEEDAFGSSASSRSSDESLVDEIDEIMTHTLEETQQIAKPFYDIVLPSKS